MAVIWHHGAWNRNFGDWVLFDSIQHHLCRAAGRSMRFVPADSQRTRYGRDLVARLNREADLLLVGGGGLVFHRPEDATVSGWQFNIALDDLAAVRVPIVVYGVGYNRFPYDRSGFPAGFAAHVRAVQSRAALFSVRNAGTRDALVAHGLDPARMEIVMDAGAFAPCDAVALPALEGDGPLIGVNVAGDRPGHRYPAPAEANERRCHAVLADVLACVVERTGARVLLIPHIVDIDDRLHDVYIERIGRERCIDLKAIAPQIYPPAAVTASLLVGVYDRCDAVLGMRGHACIIAYGRGVPFVAVGEHAKTRYLLSDVGLAERNISTDAILRNELSAEAIADRVLNVLNDHAAVEWQRQRLTDDRQHFEEFNRRVAGLVAGDAWTGDDGAIGVGACAGIHHG